MLAVLLALLPTTTVFAQDCAQPNLSSQERLTRFQELDQQAQAAMQEKRFRDAVALYRNATCLAPNSPRGFYGLGVAEAASGEFLSARESMRKADSLQPTSPLPLVIEVRIDFSLKDLSALKADLREEASRFPSNAQLHGLLAQFLAEKKLTILALAESLRAHQAGSADMESKVQLAALENGAGAYDDAIRNAKAVEGQATLSNTVRASAAGIAGLSYESIGQRDEAVAQLQEAIRFDPSRENSYLALADVFEHAQNYPQAVEVLKQGREHLPHSVALLLPFGSDLIRMGKLQEGTDVLRQLLRQKPDEDQAYLSVADASRKMGKPQQEIDALSELARRKPNYPMIHILIARAMLDADPVDYAKILDELSKAEKSAPTDPEIFYLRGKVFLATNRYQDAVIALKRSIEFRPMEPGPYYQLGRLYQKLGKSSLAREQFKRLELLETTESQTPIQLP
jgi:tetratricopeptide (TPR) repeat protein